MAAHWKYKEESVPRSTAPDVSEMAWLRQLVELAAGDHPDPAEFLESLRFDLGAAEVYVRPAAGK